MGLIWKKPQKLETEKCKELCEGKFITPREVLLLYDLWLQLGAEDVDDRINSYQLLRLPGLFEHAWAERICRVFAHSKDPKTGLSMFYFTNFLDMVNAFHLRTPEYIKTYWLFTLYDFDGDGNLNGSDIQRLLKTTCGKEMPFSEIVGITARLFEECDQDHNKGISKQEFSRIVSRFNKVEDNFVIDFFLPLRDLEVAAAITPAFTSY